MTECQGENTEKIDYANNLNSFFIGFDTAKLLAFSVLRDMIEKYKGTPGSNLFTAHEILSRLEHRFSNLSE